MAKIIHESKENVSEAFMCPHCGATFEAKAEDIIELSESFTTADFITFHKRGHIKCPCCTNKLEISYDKCKNIFLKKAFYRWPSEIKTLK